VKKNNIHKFSKMQRKVLSKRKTDTKAEVLAKRLARSKQAFNVLLNQDVVAKMNFAERKYYRDRALLFAQKTFNDSFGVKKFSDIEKVRAPKQDATAQTDMVEAAETAEVLDTVEIGQ
jgi:hypothetical protein